MPVTIICPLCNKQLSVPRKTMGSMATCPKCQGTFLMLPGAVVTVSENGGETSTATGASAEAPRPSAPAMRPAGDSTATPRAPAAAPSAMRPRPAPAPVPPALAAALAPDASVTKPAEKSTAKAGPKKARMITSATVASNVHLAADGKLPELKLNDGESEEEEEKAADKKGEGGTNPIVLIGVMCGSVLFSVLLVLAEFETSEHHTSDKASARHELEDFYTNLGDPNKPDAPPPPPVPYQILLREAKQAFTRGDFAGERAMYRRVLDLLHSEGRNRFTGLTGSPHKDEDLEKILSTLLAK